MVSPPNKYGATIEPIAGSLSAGGMIEASKNGDMVSYFADTPIVAAPAGNRAPEGTQIFSLRGPSDWSSIDIATPHDEVGSGVHTGQGSEYKLFSADLSLSIVEPRGETPLPPLVQGAEKTIYLRDSSNGNYVPLVTEANVRAGAKFGEEKTRQPKIDQNCGCNT